MNKVTIVHVDDQAKQLSLVKKLLDEIPEVELLAQFNNAEKAVTYFLENEVDLAILDVEMPGKDGFWLVDQIKHTRTAVVFLTSHPDYALKAFDACALHYILKPVTGVLIREAIRRYIDIRVSELPDTALNSDVKAAQISELVSNYLAKGTYPRRIFINNVHKTTVLNLADVLYMVSQGPYTMFRTRDGGKYTASKLLKIYYEALQNHPDFVRIHRAHIINKNYVKAILRNKHKILAQMIDGEELEVSPQKREEIYGLLAM